MAEAAFTHFEGLLGTSVDRQHSLDLDFLDTHSEDLSELEAVFTEDEIWEAIRRLPVGKAPGPDGFTAEFLQKCWGVVKGDFMAAFDKLFTLCGRGFQGLNQALLILLPKRPDVDALGDYRPISLIHIFAKLVAKALATRLAPRMELLVDRNQCAFIRKRCIHDNFMLVQQTARFLHREKEPRVMLKLDIARAFDSVSWGLRTNFAKCSVSPIACSEAEDAGAAELMECQLAPFPVRYLGIPLSIRRLTTAAFQPLLDRLADKLPTWRASMMPRAGRLALIRSVLEAIPLHQLMVLSLDKKALKQVNKILRGFLWAGRADANGGHCHVNWARVCRPLRLGGLGIPDLARTAISLRVRWIWRLHTDHLRPWRGLDMHFSKTELDVFAASTYMVVGNGESALFWEDRWLDGRSIKVMAPEVYALVPKRRRKVRIVREALVERTWIPDIAGAPSALAMWQYVQLWGRLRDTQLSWDPDRLVWRWTTDGQYSAGSCYDTLFQGQSSQGLGSSTGAT
ncbi:uncharacterized protein [Lolium perenne]|uniref:uncharacterized protein n=1 Tax=Lolium perenne TaxID=4522 RepID=UPI003A9995FC